MRVCDCATHFSMGVVIRVLVALLVTGASLAAPRPAPASSRRAFALRSLVGVAYARALGAEALDAESIRVASSSIPGLGPPDVYYPEEFRGRWSVERELYDVATPAEARSPALESLVASARNELDAQPKLRYSARYVLRGEHVIADRAFNVESFAAARRGEAERSFATPVASWDPSNPNLLTLEDSGRVIEYKVTRRATESPSATAFGFSEYSRVAEAGSQGVVSDVPVIQARRLEARYRWQPPQGDAAEGDPAAAPTRPALIEGLERVSWFDPLVTGFADLKGATPVLVTKSRVFLRQQQS